ncbi:MAG: protein translocase subunit SecF [Clostridia bacterium]|nr:protein translocase subunit SecF [Oscillospiraceae bacterium]MBQ7033031.1 protein translocase subunit SecF [Clostridia bacterium]
MNFLKAKNVHFIITAAVILIGLISYIAFGGLNFGLDFTGGTEIRMNISAEFNSDDISSIVKEAAGVQPQVQKSGETEVFIKTEEIDTEKRDAVVSAIKEKYSLDDSALLEANNVSASASKQLLTDALKALLIAVVCMLIYITIRFDLRSGLSAVIGLLANVLVLLSVYSVTRMQINSTFVAAVLTIVGYSINNTIIIFDKIRENRKLNRRAPFAEISNTALNQVLTRTINASITTLATILVLYILGIDSIREFSLPIIIGVLVGTYSSVFLATPLWVVLNSKMKKRK